MAQNFSKTPLAVLVHEKRPGGMFAKASGSQPQLWRFLDLLGFTDTQLADLLKVSCSTVGRWRQGRTPMPYHVCFLLSWAGYLALEAEEKRLSLPDQEARAEAQKLGNELYSNWRESGADWLKQAKLAYHSLCPILKQWPSVEKSKAIHEAHRLGWFANEEDARDFSESLNTSLTKGTAEESPNHVPVRKRGPMTFDTTKTYTRADIFKDLGIEPAPIGGSWFTGYTQHQGEHYIFANVGVPGRTGHNYENVWEGADLRWRGKTGSRLGQPVIEAMTERDARVHVFTRDDDRKPFTYCGLARAKKKEDGSEGSPVTVVWEFPTEEILPEEVSSPTRYREGSTKTIAVNVYERDPKARSACIQHYGAKCVVCDFEFGKVYGPVADGLIFVHHLKPLSEIGEEYEVNPITDLRPVCANCHAVLHRERPPLSIDRLKQMLAQENK